MTVDLKQKKHNVSADPAYKIGKKNYQIKSNKTNIDDGE